MELVIEKTDKLSGEITVPGSKSHTIRAVIIASLAEGVSKIGNPLKSEDTLVAVSACRELGAVINTDNDSEWIVEGFNMLPEKPEKALDLANSGTSTRLLGGIVSLFDFEVILDGDSSLRTRPMQHLLDPLNDLGAEASSVNNDGKCPIKIKGKIKGGKVDVDGVSSQFVSSLLLSAPLAEGDTEINVNNIHELPYIQMTLGWLDEQGIKYEKSKDLTYFKIKGNQKYKSFEKYIPGDWSSAAFPIVAAAITESDIVIKGLDVNDVQGDKAIIDYLKMMGANILLEESGLRVKGNELRGSEINLNDTPDALPVMAVLGCFASGKTKLYNVAQARIKETDRIKVMTLELSKMRGNIEELEDGLLVHNSNLAGGKVEGHNDHRIVMALALAGMLAEGTTRVTTAEAVNVTFPHFVDLMRSVGAKIRMEV